MFITCFLFTSHTFNFFLCSSFYILTSENWNHICHHSHICLSIYLSIYLTESIYTPMLNFPPYLNYFPVCLVLFFPPLYIQFSIPTLFPSHTFPLPSILSWFLPFFHSLSLPPYPFRSPFFFTFLLSQFSYLIIITSNFSFSFFHSYSTFQYHHNHPPSTFHLYT